MRAWTTQPRFPKLSTLIGPTVILDESTPTRPIYSEAYDLSRNTSTPSTVRAGCVLKEHASASVYSKSTQVLQSKRFSHTSMQGDSELVLLYTTQDSYTIYTTRRGRAGGTQEEARPASQLSGVTARKSGRSGWWGEGCWRRWSAEARRCEPAPRTASSAVGWAAERSPAV